MDRTLGNGTTRGRIINVYFKPEKVLCEYNNSSNCCHAPFALSIPDVKEF